MSSDHLRTVTDLDALEATCGRCGFSVRAMVRADTLAAYPDRALWAERCWGRPEAKTPLACSELQKALRAAGRLGRRPGPERQAAIPTASLCHRRRGALDP